MTLLPQPNPKPQPNPEPARAAFALIALAITATLTTATPTPASAGDPARAKAKQHFDTAERAYAAEQFNEAIGEYTRAYETLPLPAFLFNIGQCHRGLEQHEQAIAHYERYLKEAGTPDDRELVEQLITESKAALAAKPTATTTQEIAQQIANDIAQQVAEDELTPADQPTQLTATDPNLVATTTPAAPPQQVYEAWWFWPAVATVAVVVAGGTILAVASGGDDRTVLPSGSAGTLDWRSP